MPVINRYLLQYNYLKICNKIEHDRYEPRQKIVKNNFLIIEKYFYSLVSTSKRFLSIKGCYHTEIVK